MATAQQLRLETSYQYLHASLWNQTIQTYNFSRPYLDNKQPLLRHGFGLSASYLFGSASDFSHGIALSYSRFGSNAENTDFNSTFIQNFLSVGYVLHYQRKESPVFSELQLSALSGMLTRRINGEAFEFDSERAKAYGIGGQIDLKIGYEIALNEKWFLAPFIGVGYVPYFYTPNTESILNQTTELVSEEEPSLFRASFGVILRK